MGADLFEIAAERLEQYSDLTRLESRGTLRIGLKRAGVDPGSLTLEELRVVFARIMPGEMEKRGAAQPDSICGAVMKSVASCVDEKVESDVASRDEIIRRLGSA